MKNKKIKKIIIGTNNKGKLKEIRDLLPKKVKILSTADFNLDSPKETGKTFRENSLIKSLEYNNIDPNYRVLVERIVRNKKIRLITDISPESIIEVSDATISIPFTSTAVTSYNKNKETIYYKVVIFIEYIIAWS